MTDIYSGRAGLVKEITSVSNPIIKEIRALSQRKTREATGQFMAEGLKLVASGIEAGWTISTFIFGKKVADHELVQKMAATTKSRGGLVLAVNDAVLAKIARRDNPQMVIGVFEKKWAKPSDFQAREAHCWVALDNVKDPGNLGTIIRTADASGAKGVMLIGETTDPFALEAARASMGSLFHVPLLRYSQEDFMKWRHTWKGQVVGTHLAGAVDYRTVEYNKPTLLLMGNEQKGLGEDVAGLCDTLVKIPQSGQADSLNLAVATGVMLFEIQREKLTF